MSDLISRSELLQEFELETFIHNGGELWHWTGIKAIIENQPTVEAKPVVRGKWEQRTEWDEDNNAIFECTNCRHGDVQAKGVEVPYCWYCGADMRGGKNE